MSAKSPDHFFKLGKKRFIQSSIYIHINLFPKHLTHFIIKISHVEARDPTANYVNLDDKP